MIPVPQPQDKGELEYGSILPNGEDWRLRKFDAGMGESEYRIFRNEKFFSMFDNRDDADIVMVAMTCPTHSAGEVLDELGKAHLVCMEKKWDTMCGDDKCIMRDPKGKGADFCRLSRVLWKLRQKERERR